MARRAECEGQGAETPSHPGSCLRKQVTGLLVTVQVWKPESVGDDGKTEAPTVKRPELGSLG